MKVRERGSNQGDLLSGRIELDPAGERAPWVTLDDGTRIGSLIDILPRFDIEEASSEHNDMFRAAILGRELEAQALDLDTMLLDVEKCYSSASRRMPELPPARGGSRIPSDAESS